MGGEGQERRRFERKQLDTEVRYAVLYPLFKKGITQDISEGGLCLLLGEQMNKGDILRIEFDLPEEKVSHVEAIVRVMWQRKKEEKFLTGVEFLT